MIRVIKGDIFNLDVEAIVNPVNCAGVMGSGLAKKFRIRYPEYHQAYKAECESFAMSLGVTTVYQRHEYENPKYIFNFPTKYHWADSSEMRSIDVGMNSLLEQIAILKIKSVAIPALGCGLGGLLWRDVLSLLKFKLKEFPELQATILSPVP